MKIYKTQEEINADIEDGMLAINGDVKFECSFSINASIVVTGDVDAWDIDALNINARDINALDINAENIRAENIDAMDIKAMGINARDISYHAFCTAYASITCVSCKARRTKNLPPICLDGELTIKEPEPKQMTHAEVEEKLGYKIKIV